jgi:hypothetical protein
MENIKNLDPELLKGLDMEKLMQEFNKFEEAKRAQ